MTHPNFITNGSSLEDCHTNFFALADLCGIRWRRLAATDGPLACAGAGAQRDLLEDPVLSSYSKCLAADLLCVWRRVIRSSGGGDGGPPSARPDVAGPQAAFTKELWIFWYGNEPELKEYLSSELHELEQGSWENGLSYECRTLLFKAFHNLIERCLLSRGFARFGRWFVQPQQPLDPNLPAGGSSRQQSSTSATSSAQAAAADDGLGDTLRTQLTIAFNFFVHGESTVCASIDVRQHPPVHRICKNLLSTAAALHAAAHTQPPSAAAGGPSAGVNVILSPYGISGTLTGQTFKESDPAVQKLLNEWKQFYPIPNIQSPKAPKSQQKKPAAGGSAAGSGGSPPFLADMAESEAGTSSAKRAAEDPQTVAGDASGSQQQLPPMVEVIVAGSRMKYPSCYVYMTTVGSNQSLGPASTAVPTSATTVGSSSLLTPPNSPPETAVDGTKLRPPIMAPRQPTIPTAGFLLRDPVSQEIIVASRINSAAAADKSSSIQATASSGNTSSTMPSETSASNVNKWDFCDPCSKTTCICFRCKLAKKGNAALKAGPANANKGKPEKTEKLPKVQKGIAFHRRNLAADLVALDSPLGEETGAAAAASTSATAQVSNAPLTSAGQSALSLQPAQPKTPSAAYKSPMGGLASIASNATTPGIGLDSPRSMAPSMSGDGPPSTNPEQSLTSSVSPHPGARGDADSQQEHTLLGRSPASAAPREKSHLEQLLSPYPSASVGSVKPSFAESPAISNQWTPGGSGTASTTLPGPTETAATAPEATATKSSGIKSIVDSHGIKRPILASCFEEAADPVLRTAHLYDYTPLHTLTENWDLPVPKRRRGVYAKDAGNLDSSLSTKQKQDPYEFSEFDDDPFGTKKNQDASYQNGDAIDGALPNGCLNNENLSVNSPPRAREFTRADDLTPSLGDLDNLFDTSSGEESSDQTTSVNRQNPLGVLNGIEKQQQDQSKGATGLGTAPNANSSNNGSNGSNNNQTTVTATHALPELLRMFPTPPSLEPNAAPSPMEGGVLDEINSFYPNSPLEHLKDASYVYKPPVQCKFIASTKYSPLQHIPSINSLPSDCTYKSVVKATNQQPATSATGQRPTRPPGYVHHSPGSIPVPHPMMQPGHHPRGAMSPYFGGPNSRMAGPIRPAGAHFGAMSPHPPGMQAVPNKYPFMQSHDQSPRPMVNPNMYSPHHGPHDIPGPHMPYGPFSNHGQPSPRTMSHMSPMGSHGAHPAPGMAYDPTMINMARHRMNEAPQEANALIINLALSDSMMNVYKDHNFESCTLCVCNMNLKGADVGVYLPDALVPGIYDESQYKCTCGFSAIVNRHRSAVSGLFYEDEVEITGVYYDPVEGLSQRPERTAKAIEAGLGNGTSFLDTDQLNPSLVDLIRLQCSSLFPSCSVFSKSLYLNLTGAPAAAPGNSIVSRSGPNMNQVVLGGLKVVSRKVLTNSPNAIFRSDSCELTFFALKSGKGALDAYPSKLELQQWADKRALKASCLHEWLFVETQVPGNNLETIRYLRSLQPLLQASVQKKPQAMWEVTYNVAGPLTWRQFHRLAGRGTEDQCEPQPIPSLLVGHDKDWVSLSPFALKYWEKLPLEPYSVQRDVAYLVVAPNNQNYLFSHLRTFFKELSTTYELMKLGKHAPCGVVVRDGILKVPPSNKNDINTEEVDEWFNKIGDSDVAAKIRLYAQVCKAYLLALVSTLKTDKTIYDSAKPSTPTKSEAQSQSASHPPQQKPPQPSDSSDGKGNGDDNGGEGPSHGLPSFSTMAQQENEEEDPTRQPAIVIYMVEPFTLANLDKETYRLACLGLLRCYTMIFNKLPIHIQRCLNLQIVSLDAILESATDFRTCTRHEQLKSLALSVYSQCRKSPTPPHISKSLTGFGPAASLDTFLKEHASIQQPSRLYCPPFVLAPLKDKQTELGHMFGDQREKSHNLFVCYCLTEDQRWLVASCSNERGDLLDSTLINVEILNRTRRRKATVRRFGLQKLMEFILQVMSDSVQPWRLIVGRLGRVGHGELREWSSLLSKKALLRYSKNIKEPCSQCKSGCSHDVPLILSACLISLEADTALRVFSDQFTPDDRFSSSCNTCSLSTPEDASCTHILTFPTSTTMQSSQGINFQIDPIGMGSMGDDDLMNAFGADTEDLGVDDGIGGLFDWGDPDDPTMPSSPMDGGHGLGMGRLDSPTSRQTGFDNSSARAPGGVLGGGTDEPCQLLQQPLALGYYVSTAPTGMLPRWFWSSAPHLRESRPSFLKSALLIHIPSVHSNSDDLLQSNNNKNYHPLDSNLTTDVLRYVLEGYNSLSWLSLDPATHDRTSCLPVHIQTLLQLYHTVQALT